MKNFRKTLAHLGADFQTCFYSEASLDGNFLLRDPSFYWSDLTNTFMSSIVG